MMDISFDSEQASSMNKMIFETIYFASVMTSNEIAMERSKYMALIKQVVEDTDPSLISSCKDEEVEYIEYISNDKIDEDTWKSMRPIKEELKLLTTDYVGAYSSFIGSPISHGKLQFDLWNVDPLPNRYDWKSLRESIKRYGIRNSLLFGTNAYRFNSSNFRK